MRLLTLLGILVAQQYVLRNYQGVTICRYSDGIVTEHGGWSNCPRTD